MMDKIKKEIANTLSKITRIKEMDVAATLEIPKEGFGDLSSKVAFVVAKQEKKNPVEIAKELEAKLKPPKYVEKIEIAGPYLNFYFSEEFYSDSLKKLMKKDFGKGKKKKGKVLIEFPSVNPNKPWHIGHLRNALLGDSVARILEFAGYEVQRLDYIDDLGLQVAQSLYGYLQLLSGPKRRAYKKFDHFVGEDYVRIAEEMEKYPQVQEKVRELIKIMEEGKDNETTKAWGILVDQCVKAQYETAFNFGIYHDALIYESSIVETIFHEGLEFLKKNNAMVREKEGKNAGCWVVKLGEKFANLTEPDKILIRSDGTATYTGKDVILQLWKFGKLKGDFVYSEFIKQPNGKTAYRTSKKGKKMDFGKVKRVINVIGVEQKYPQQVIVEVLKRLNYSKEAENSVHLAYEHVGLPDEKFSGREGTWIGFTTDELLEEAEKRVREKIKSEMSKEEKTKVAKIVGLGAIKFSFLHPSSEKKIVFNWDRALNLEGDSGPYIQYAVVRTKGILNKVGGKGTIAKSYKFNEDEKRLIKMLLEMPEVVEKSAENLSVNHLADYVLHCANAFNKFYATSPVLTAENKETKKARLIIVESTNKVLTSSLNLIGIESPEKM